MNEMKTLTIDDITYEVVDETARSNVDNAVKKSGDTMNGVLTINAPYSAVVVKDSDSEGNSFCDLENYNGVTKVGVC